MYPPGKQTSVRLETVTTMTLNEAAFRSYVDAFNRSDFDVKQYVPLVGDDITLTITGAFLLQP